MVQQEEPLHDVPRDPQFDVGCPFGIRHLVLRKTIVDRFDIVKPHPKPLWRGGGFTTGDQGKARVCNHVLKFEYREMINRWRAPLILRQ